MSKRKRIRQLEAQVALLIDQKKSMQKRLDDANKTIETVRRTVGGVYNIGIGGGGGGGGMVHYGRQP
jgi:prefoldin subunit 5